jgi:hypothetical protein
MAKRYELVVRLSVDLRGVEPTVRRRFAVPAEMTLADLHRVLQVTFQWDETTRTACGSGRSAAARRRSAVAASARRSFRKGGIKIATLARRGHQRLRYEYDFSDGWLHDIRVLQVRKADAARPAPVLLHAQGRTPSEDYGAPAGYAGFLAILDDPTHPDHAAWYPEGIDPHAPEI